MKKIFLFLANLLFIQFGFAQSNSFNGIGVNMDNLHLLSEAETLSISPENLTGERGKGGKATLEEGSAAHCR
jgi:hypothetical protein